MICNGLQTLSIAYSILEYMEKTLHESSGIFVEHALHVARIQFRTCTWHLLANESSCHIHNKSGVKAKSMIYFHYNYLAR